RMNKITTTFTPLQGELGIRTKGAELSERRSFMKSAKVVSGVCVLLLSFLAFGNSVYGASGHFGQQVFWNLLLYGDRTNAFADVDGGGKADAIGINNWGIMVSRSSGTQFIPGTLWAGPYWGSRGTYFADVTGDGKADAIVVNDWGITVRRSDGNRFLPNE